MLPSQRCEANSVLICIATRVGGQMHDPSVCLDLKLAYYIMWDGLDDFVNLNS